MKNLHKHICEI